MQQAEQKRAMVDAKYPVPEAHWWRMEQVADTRATVPTADESLARVAHDARSMVTALGLYCDLLEEPGVLATPFAHYGQELRLVAAASRRLVEKLGALDAQADGSGRAEGFSWPYSGRWPVLAEAAKSSEPSTCGTSGGIVRNMERHPRLDLLPASPVANLQAEVKANYNLLCALAGPAIKLTMDAEGGARSVRLTAEDLTRALVNLVTNAAEAMPSGGEVRIGLRERPEAGGAVACVALTIEDNGPGFSEAALEKVFISGYSAHPQYVPGNSRPFRHRGLGLAITRSIVEGAGGRITAGNRERGGASIEIELPVWK